MGNQIVTEADRKRALAPKPPEGMTLRRNGGGQKVSLERGKSHAQQEKCRETPTSGRLTARPGWLERQYREFFQSAFRFCLKRLPGRDPLPQRFCAAEKGR